MMQCLGVQRQRAKRASHSIGAKTYVDARWVVVACRARACWQMFAIHFSTVLSNSWSLRSRAGHMHLLTLRAPRLGYWQEQRSSAHPAPPTGLTMVASTAGAHHARRARRCTRRQFAWHPARGIDIHVSQSDALGDARPPWRQPAPSQMGPAGSTPAVAQAQPTQPEHAGMATSSCVGSTWNAGHPWAVAALGTRVKGEKGAFRAGARRKGRVRLPSLQAIGKLVAVRCMRREAERGQQRLPRPGPQRFGQAGKLPHAAQLAMPEFARLPRRAVPARNA